MHKFYLTNNLGGGGTNVSRLYDYIEKIEFPNIGLLLNYYYLTGQAKPSFDVQLIKEISHFSDINEFANYCRDYFSKKRETSLSFVSSANYTNINSYILDNGCGNILRNFLKNGSSHEDISKMIKPFLDFAENLGFDLSVALDLAMKYTYKANEMDNPYFIKKWQELAANNSINLTLLEETLKVIKENSYKHCILAPLHGYNYKSFVDYFHEVLSLEEKHGIKFGGFALGGIADTKNLDSDLWEIPQDFTKYKKSAFLCYKLVNNIRSLTDRHIHVLGAGNIYILPFLIKAGANSSDCHSAWRRSSDGGIQKAKILIPLMDKDFNFINDNNCLEYAKIGSLRNGQYNLNCGYSIKEIQELLCSKNKEDFYFAEIIMFIEAIIQYDILIKFIQNNHSCYLDKLTKTPDRKLNDNYCNIIKYLNI